MSRKVYFVCATPGSLGNFVTRLIKGLIDSSAELTDFSQLSYNETMPALLTKDFFFNNVILPEEGDIILAVPFTPDYDIIFSRFPTAKVAVITHTVNECSNIARSYFKSYYYDSYEISSSANFRKMLQDHAHLFSNVNATPSELSAKETAICDKIITYQKLLDGFCNTEILNSPNVIELKFNDLVFNTTTIENILEQFTGGEFSDTERTLTRDLTTHYIQQYLSFSRNPFTS